LNIDLIDPYVVKVLKANNWTMDRKIDIVPVIEQLKGEGYQCFEYAKEVLESLNGISIDVDSAEGYMGAQFAIDALEGGSGEYDRLEDFEQIAGEKLFSIGHNAIEFIYVGESKNIYGGSCMEFRLIGNNIEEYLNRNFIKDTPFKVLWRGYDTST